VVKGVVVVVVVMVGLRMEGGGDHGDGEAEWGRVVGWEGVPSL
jgi:hypothetical protein